MAAELIRPGVEILQVARTPTPTFLTPTLSPCVVGAAFEVLNVLTPDGTLNSNAKYGSYDQVGKTITQSSFPDPRSNIEELDIQEATVRPFMLLGGNLSELLMGPGEAFLMANLGASAAGMKSAEFAGTTGLAIVGKQLCLAIDQNVRVNTTEDATVTFEAIVGGSATNLTSQEAADQINAAVGVGVATVVGVAPNDRVLISSPTFGAGSSVTIRQGYTANSTIELGYSGSSAAHEERVEGAGFRAQDDSDNDTTSPWVEFYRGAYLLDGTDTTFVATRTGLTAVATGSSYTSAKGSAVTFGDSNTIPVKAGDFIYADGGRVKSGEISKVESTRFKVGTINTALSTADANGRYTSKVYVPQEFGTYADGSPFVPTYVWFKACGLNGAETPVAATITGTNTGIAATPGIAEGATISDSASYTLAGLTLDVTVMVDGVETDHTFTFTGGPYSGTPSAGYVESAIGPFDFRGLSSLTTFLQIAFNAGGNQGFNLAAVAAVVTGTGGATAPMSNETMEVRVDSDPVQIVTFGTEASIALQVALLNNQLTGCHSEAVDANNIKIISDKRGTSAHLRTSNVAAGITTKTGIANNADETGTGDTTDLGVVTAAEIAVVLSTLTNGTATDVGGKLRVTSATTGVLSTATVNAASTADVIMGGQFATNATGSGAASSGGLNLVAAAIGSEISGVTASKSTPAGDNTTFLLTTDKTGSTQAVTVKSTGTANLALGFSESVDATGTGTDVEFPAIMDTAVNTFATSSLTGKKLSLQVSVDGGLTYGSAIEHIFAGEHASAASVAAELNADATWSASFGALDGGSTKLRFYSKSTVGDVVFEVGSGNTCDGAGNLSGVVDATFSRQSAKGSTLSFTLNDNPHIYKASLSSNSLVETIEQINIATGTTTGDVAGASENTLKLTSFLGGVGSKLKVATGTTATTFGMSTSEATGSGRPVPDAYLDDTNNLVIGSEIIRDLVTGFPLDQDQSVGTLYVQYKALRRDVSAVAAVAGVVRISDQLTLADVLSPLNEENPLGLGVFLCMINAPNLEVKCLGVDEVSAAAPEGTQAAWARAAGFLESEEVYSIAPLTQDEVVHGIWSAHVSVMSEAEQGGERIVTVNKAMPIRKNSVVAASGSEANSTSTTDQVQLDTSPAAGLVAAGVNPSYPFTVANGVYLEIEVDGELRRYNVSSVSGALASFNRTFTADQNSDGFYSTTEFNVTLINAAWSLKVRGVSLGVPGSNPSRLDYSLVADTVAGMNESVKNRRVYSVFPDTIKTTVDGVEKSLPGYYACAAIAGMDASQPPQQGFTNFPISGITGVSGPEKFSRKQLNVMAGGGTYILWQETPGAAVTCRHQVSTDLTSIEHRERSITKSVDFTAKFIRTAVRRYIGTLNVNSQFLDTIGTTISGLLQFLVESGVLNGANLNNVIQDASNPDTVLVDITLEVAYPANYIKVTLVV